METAPFSSPASFSSDYINAVALGRPQKANERMIKIRQGTTHDPAKRLELEIQERADLAKFICTSTDGQSPKEQHCGENLRVVVTQENELVQIGVPNACQTCRLAIECALLERMNPRG